MSLDEIVKQVESYNCKLVEITGGRTVAAKRSTGISTSLTR